MKSPTSSLFALIAICAVPFAGKAEEPPMHDHTHMHQAVSMPEETGPAPVLWLSDSFPGVKAPASHQHEPSKDGQQHEHSNSDNAVTGEAEHTSNHNFLWFRAGTDPQRSAAWSRSLGDSTLHVLGANGDHWDVTPNEDQGRLYAEIPLSTMGFFNAYLNQSAVVGGVLNVTVAKAEMLKGTCCMKYVDPAQEKPIIDAAQPFDLVREHMPDEKLFTRIVSGDKVGFTVLSHGKPFPGARVTMSTQMGWNKTLIADGNGRVEFTFIRDYFPSWSNFYRYAKQNFLLVAEAEVPETGSLNGTPYQMVHYRTSLAGKYQPSPYDYRSYAYGLGIAFGFAALVASGIYLYRRRRVKPFQEVRFHEAA